MKKLAPYFLMLSIVFASCSSNESEEVLNNRPQETDLLQSYTIKRNAEGAYSIDFNTTNNTDVTTVTNVDKSKEIILSEVNHTTQSEHSNDFTIENDQLKIGFLESNKGKRTKIFVEDENITFAKKGITEFLNSYSITANGDGTFQLNFIVSNDVTTEFIYNDDSQTYEIHLSNGQSKKTSFSRQLEIKSGNTLKLNFVNHKTTSAKGLLASRTSEKPKISIEYDI